MNNEEKQHEDDDNTENGNLGSSVRGWFSRKIASSPEEDSTATKENEQENGRQMESCDHGENTQTQEEEEEKGEKVRDKERAFPDAFYCPVTGDVMKDPVVHPDGSSFERSAVVGVADDDDTEEVVYYPNRALQALIQNEVLRRDTTPLQRTIDSVRRSISSTLPLTSQEFNPLPEQYHCSITLDIMRNPVIDPDGHTFDRRAIVNWIRKNGTSPATRKRVRVKQLYKNNAIMDLLEEEASRDEKSMHPGIRQWKEQAEAEEDEDDEVDLEEGDYDSGDDNSIVFETPLTMEEIEENRRRLRQHRRYLKFRALVALALVVIGILYYPYLTISVVVIMLIVVHFLEKTQARQRHRERLARERGRDPDETNEQGTEMQAP